MKLSRISLALLPLLSLCSVQAAVYSVVEVGQVEELKSTYAAGINNAGDTVFNGAIKLIKVNDLNQRFTDFQLYNFPLDLNLIDLENETLQSAFTEQQLADLLNGNVTADILNILLNINPVSQPIGDAISFMKNTNGNAQNILLRDSQAKRGNNEYLLSINDAGVAVGFANSTYSYQSFTAAPTAAVPEPATVNLWVPDLPYLSAVIVNNNTVTTITAPYTELGGGFTVARKITNDKRIAGFGSAGMNENIYEAITTSCVGATMPVDLCLYNNAVGGSYQQRAMVWQLQEDGSVSAPAVYGFLGNKNTGSAHDGEEFDNIIYFSQANAVNSSGIAVGVSMYSDSDRIERYQVGNFLVDGIYRQAHASIFVDDQVLPIVDPKEWFLISTGVLGSAATDINDNNIVIGYANKVINSSARSKMFIHDYNAGQTRFPTGFFTSSTTVPNAINNSNQVVGNAEVIIGGTTIRRKHGFIYDLASDSFSDLNTLVGCNAPYTIVDAVDINDNGVITATALMKKERRDLLGAPVLDSAGNPILEDVSTVLQLQPIANGEAEDCNADDREYERQSGAFNVVWLLLGAGLLWRRRVKR